jgi:hypothetical protein
MIVQGPHHKISYLDPTPLLKEECSGGSDLGYEP